MENSKNDDGIVSDDEDDAIGKTPRENAPDFRTPPQKQVKERAFNCALHGRTNLERKLQP